MVNLWQRAVGLGVVVLLAAPVLAREGILPVLPQHARPNIQIERVPERVCWHNNARYSVGARLQMTPDAEVLICGNLYPHELNGAVGWLSLNPAVPAPISPQGSRTLSSQGQ